MTREQSRALEVREGQTVIGQTDSQYANAAAGRSAVKQQRDLVARQKAKGLSTENSEELLADFEVTQATFKESLSRITREKERSRHCKGNRLPSVSWRLNVLCLTFC